MKCFRCGHDSKYSERRDGHCPQCKGKFAFEPREGARMSDVAFADAIARVSSDGEVAWGVEHLHYEVARRLKKKARGSVIGGVLLSLFALIIGSAFHVAIGLGLGLLLAFFTYRAARRVELVLSRAQFDLMWGKWCAAHGAPRRVIHRRPPNALAPPRTLEPDIPSYSFDRAVICDRARTVDLLLANNFHFENNCAVLGEGGYPAQAFEVVRKMLKNNPRLVVYVLHDATPSGCGLAHRVAREEAWFAGRVRVVDVGLRPAHAFALRGLWLRQRGLVVHTEELGGLSRAERVWLAKGWTLELAAIRPEQVIKRLYRAISEDRGGALSESRTTSDGGGGATDIVYFDTTSMGTEASASDGGGDSFG